MSTAPRRFPDRRSSRPWSVAVVLWLAVCLAGAQLAGFSHRIAHPQGVPARAAHAHDHLHDPGGWHGARADAAATGTVDAHRHDEHTTQHHCAAYDAAALGDGPPLSAAAVASPRERGARLQRPPAAVPPASRWAAFHPRAPPRA